MRADAGPGVTRGVLSGAVAGVGGWVAHASSGGAVTPAAGLVALGLSVLLGPLVVSAGRAASCRTGPRHGRAAALPVDPLRVAALALLAQVVWHTVFTVAAPDGVTTTGTAPTAAHPPLVLMAATHLLAGLLATAVAVRLDRSLLDAVARLASVVLPRALVPALDLPRPTRPRPACAEAPRRLESARLLLTRVLRGPPAGASSAGTLAVAG